MLILEDLQLVSNGDDKDEFNDAEPILIIAQRDRSKDRRLHSFAGVTIIITLIVSIISYIILFEDVINSTTIILILTIIVFLFLTILINKGLAPGQVTIYHDRIISTKRRFHDTLVLDPSVEADVVWEYFQLKDNKELFEGMKPQKFPSYPNKEYYTRVDGIIFRKGNHWIRVTRADYWVIPDMEDLWDIFIDLVRKNKLRIGPSLDKFLQMNEMNIV